MVVTKPATLFSPCIITMAFVLNQVKQGSLGLVLNLVLTGDLLNLVYVGCYELAMEPQ